MTDFSSTIAIVDDDDSVRESLAAALEGPERKIVLYPHGLAFLQGLKDGAPDLVFLDLKMPQLSGLDVLRRLKPLNFPVIMISAHGDISAAVQAVKLGAFDFIEKPFTPAMLDAAVARALDKSAEDDSGAALEALTGREREVARALNDGLTNKEIARELDVSPRTIEIHRARVFSKLGVRNVAGLVKLLSERSAEI
ncbi:MAG: response regulator transcription factor [Euryhalocaulis sp.]|uniref:response regulator transcription factor n=1 Tax=Euryhalocaulis sp. TaxID=2744307 RepID=UPI0017A0AB9E|nr:response regulator [Euryhalocaulis sp.]MBA4800822.1 response regulator transcription factor [Euryhalocaulis sp.]